MLYLKAIRTTEISAIKMEDAVRYESLMGSVAAE